MNRCRCAITSHWLYLHHSVPQHFDRSLSSGNERIPSTASQGNILESINITLNLLHLHYVDRDLHRTGNSIVVITPGNG